MVSNKKFSELLKLYRQKKKLSLRQLQELSGIGNQNISAWETGKPKTCGPETAASLANALNLSGDERREFLYAATRTTAHTSVVKDSERYPIEVLDAVACMLRDAGIGPEDIATVQSGSVAYVNENIPIVRVSNLKAGAVFDPKYISAARYNKIQEPLKELTIITVNQDVVRIKLHTEKNGK